MASLYYSKPEIKIRASGVNIRINNDEFVIQDFDKIDNIMITAKSGYISLYALKLLALKRITLTLHNLNGQIIYHILPESPNKDIGNRILQYQQYLKNRVKIAKEIVKVKKQRYEKLLEKLKLPALTSDIENVFSNEYFARIGKLINDYGYSYNGRKGFYYMSNQKATNTINAVMNFYYGFIEHRLLTQIYRFNYDYNISYLHEPQYNKLPLTYDLIEFIRSDIDNVVLKMAKDRMIKNTDFLLTKEGYYMLKEDKIKRYLKEIEPVENKTEKVLDDFTNILSSIA